MSEGKPLRAFPALYAVLFQVIVEAAREHGYAAAVHGSLARDLDVLCAPWTEEAGPADVLVGAVKERIGALDLLDLGHSPERSVARKPHGRLAYTLVLTGGAFVDLSVMPRTETQ